MTPADKEAWLARFVQWAEGQSDLRAAILVGSQARRDRPADEWSDLDVVLFTREPELYLESAGWLSELGTPWLTFLEPTAVGVRMERRTLFEPDLDVDFAVFSAADLEHLPENPEVQGVLRRGFRVLLDREGVGDRLASLPPERRLPELPSAAEFQGVIHDFLYHVVWAAKKRRRGELFTAWDCWVGCLVWRLVRMMRWHALATRGLEHDTWHSGRFVERWADPRAVAALREAAPRYDEAEVGRALPAALELFRWLGEETGARLGFAYPVYAHERAAAVVEALGVGR